MKPGAATDERSREREVEEEAARAFTVPRRDRVVGGVIAEVEARCRPEVPRPLVCLYRQQDRALPVDVPLSGAGQEIERQEAAGGVFVIYDYDGREIHRSGHIGCGQTWDKGHTEPYGVNISGLDYVTGKVLRQENSRLKRLLAEAELDKAILKEALSGN